MGHVSQTPSSSTSFLSAPWTSRGVTLPGLSQKKHPNLPRGSALAAVPSVSRRRSLVPQPHQTRTAAHLRLRTRDGRKFTCARSDEHAAWHNASNFHAKHASVLRSQPVTRLFTLKGSVVPAVTPLQLDFLRSFADARLKWSSYASRIKQTIMCHHVCGVAKLRTLKEINIK